MATGDEEQRRIRAIARRARMTVERVPFGDESNELGPFGLEGMELAAALSMAATAMSGTPPPPRTRQALAIRWVPSRS